MSSGLCEPDEDSLNRIPSFERSGSVIPKWRSFTLDDFEVGSPLGKGGFGHVFFARHRTENVFCALKKIRKSKLQESEKGEKLLKEIDIHDDLRHPNILRLYAYFQDATHIYMILEFAQNGDLSTIMQEQPEGRLKNPLAARYVSQVASALDYCHENDVIHRDIKPPRLLVSASGDIRLADFGLSVHAPKLQPQITYCGNAVYTAPEIILNKNYDHHVDIWSLGVLTFELLAGYLPFRGKKRDEVFCLIKNKQFEFPDHFTKSAQKFIKKLLRFVPEDRMCLSEAMTHRWMTTFKAIDDKNRLK